MSHETVRQCATEPAVVQSNQSKYIEPPRKTGIFTATSKPPPPLEGFENFTDQVAGHLESHNAPCFMTDGKGHVLKILDKGSKLVYMEQSFYEKIFEDEENGEWLELKQFIPGFCGIVRFTHEDRELCYLKLQNLVSNFEKPCVMDLKIGKKTYDPFATPEKIHRELIRYDFQAQLGFRITGFKVFKAKTGKTELYDRFACKKLTPNDMEETLSYFFDLEDFPERVLLITQLLTKAKRLMKWFETQKRIKFYCTSLLIAYDGSKTIGGKLGNGTEIDQSNTKDVFSESIADDEQFNHLANNLLMDADDINRTKKNISNGKQKLLGQASLDVVSENDVVMSMIDFTHTFIDLENTSDSIDENYMYGLGTLINIFQQMLL